MNPIVKEKWVKALLSGQYQQGIAHLHIGNKYCCLGVLCDLAVQEGIIDPPILKDREYQYAGQHTCTLPTAVSDWAGVDCIGALPTRDTLAWMNDRGVSFVGIADAIQTHL